MKPPTDSIPAKQDINVYGSLDELAACEHFLGKDVEEAEKLFWVGNALTHTEDLMWMGSTAFRYYVFAAINYLLSDSAFGDSDAVNGFAGMLEFRFDLEPEELKPISQDLYLACRSVLEQWDRFDISEIYGDLRERYLRLQRSFLSLTTL